MKKSLNIRKSVTALSTTLALGAWSGQASANWFAPSVPVPATPSQNDNPAPAVDQVAAKKNASHDGVYLGAAYDAYWGNVQVQATIRNGRLVSVDVPQFPDHRNTSRAINRQALPYLQQEVIKAQSTRVNLISGATLTSEAYLRSLKSALKQAGY